MTSYKWEDFNNPKVTQLRNEFDLGDVIFSGKDEFEKQLLLKDWVHNTLHSGSPIKDYSQDSAFEILNDSKAGKPMWCTQYAFTYLQCGIALGWYARKLGVDTDHTFGEEEMHHGVTDIWSNQFQKWYVVDALNNTHFEKDSIPLNALEIRSEYLTNSAKDVLGIVGNRKSKINFTSSDKGFHTPSNYFWFFVSLRNNFFEEPGLFNTKTLLRVDKYNKDKIWYKDGGKKGESVKHSMYENQFIETSVVDECFPKI